MTPKAKAIVSVLLGFIAILVIGVAAIVLLRAKRSTAPETNLPSNVVQVKSGELVMNRPKPFNLPTEKTAFEISFSDLPEDLRGQFQSTLLTAKIYKVTYEGGFNGYRFEQDAAVSLQSAIQAWKTRFPGWRGVRANNRNNMYELEVSKEGMRVYVQLDLLTEGTTGEKIRVLYEK